MTLYMRDLENIEQGIEQGLEQGECRTLYGLVRDGIMTMENAAARKGMTVEEFQQKLKELNLLV